MSHEFRTGQRWISESEPELGLGSVLRVTVRTVVVAFPASDETREYARDNAPLRRVQFRAGDTVKSQEGTHLTIESLFERQGLIIYRGEGRELCETDLCATISFNKPEERLIAGQVDEPEVFELRVAALEHQHRRRKSGVRGFVGGRIQLIPHQLYIASEVSSRLVPRVLLADEVGLGKTIEASLIVHRLLLTGRAQRVLIIVPDSLVYQWFVELLRRFNLWFHVFDEERCEAIEAANPEANPFLDDQWVLCSLNLFAGNERRLEQVLAAGWDMLVVDEAHHLKWSVEEVSPEYAVIEAISRKTPGLLLLTATPEQLGVASHFARLRLLDPARFHSLDAFVEEAAHYTEVAQLVERIRSGGKFAAKELEQLANVLGRTPKSVRGNLEKADAGDATVREELIHALMDQHGTGRVMFRNSRATITGFPRRLPHMHELEAAGGENLFERLAEEFAADTDAKSAVTFQPDFTDDPRIPWLAELLRNLAPEKILLICRTQRKVEAIDAALRTHLTINMAVFHEGLPLVQRDRNAAWFAEEDGARLLICSEIGSEGRNFQFAHHLVLFDLPLDPELLEQRIGRLDRIGQTSEIRIHVPYVPGSSQEVMARWYQEGLNAFEKNLPGGRALLEQFGARIHDLAQDFHEMESTARSELARVMEETKASCAEMSLRLEQGRDKLLDLNSFRASVAGKLVQAIGAQDADRSLDDFMIDVFDHFSIHVEELGNRVYQLGSAGVFADSFPGLPAHGLTITCERQRALSREDVQFLTWDHPLVTGALDMLLGSEKGNSSFAVWPDPRATGLYLEAIFLLECVAPPQLHVDRFLPPTPLRVLVDFKGNDASKAAPPELLARQLRKGDAYPLLDQPELREELLPALLKKAEKLANDRIPNLIADARREMTAQLEHEISRLKELQKVNRSVRGEEITLLSQQCDALNEHLQNARLRLDAVRLIQRGAN